ncbi:hypothetical protein [Streptomyces sulphureus]|uniref:hypothetical protein n=1 Tax=Streptomyces sulphureus TaxID=47758 RepID=UPI00039BCDDC|nr:hypothetical protein [Streptomyces sulphureus]
MPRRVSLPAADELFRTTGGPAVQPSVPQQNQNDTPQRPRVPSPASGADDSGARAEHTAADEAGTSGDADSSADGPDHAEAEQNAAEPGRGNGTSQNSPAPHDRSPERAPAARSAPEAQGQRRTRKAAESARNANEAQSAGGSQRRGRANRRPSGRERHDEKITVYVSAEELMDLEHARLVLRGEHGLAVDRGRVVREAVAVVLADLESRGEASILVRRLRGR